MKISIRLKILLLALCILAGNFFIAYTFYKSNQKNLDAELWVRHTEQVIYQSEKILSLSTDIETSARGFILTDDSTFLEPLLNAEKKIFVNIGQLKQLTGDNPRQQLRIDTLDEYIHKRLDFSRQGINLRSNQGITPAVAYTLTKQGKYFSDEIRRIIYDVQKEENILLLARKQTSAQSIKLFNYLPFILFALMAVFAVILLIGTNKYLSQTKEKEKRAAELVIANKELAFQNNEKENRASELVIANKELAYQNDEKENRASELIIANKELAFQNDEKEDRANELKIANKELTFQNNEKEKRAIELTIANSEIVERTKQLESAINELESFSYSVSHDLRAPLRAVDGYARMLEEDYDVLFDDEGKRLLKQVQKNAKKMGVLIDDLLAFSRLGRKELKRSNINMNTLIETVLAEIKQTVPFTGEVKFKDLLPVMADHSLMPPVITNLLSNAIKYSSTKEKPLIEITSKKENGSVIYSIKDNGVGFDMQYEHKLFGVFQRLHSSEEFPGTGVGLAIVQRIIHKHQGKIWATAKISEGATFSFSLPDINDNNNNN